MNKLKVGNSRWFYFGMMIDGPYTLKDQYPDLYKLSGMRILPLRSVGMKCNIRSRCYYDSNLTYRGRDLR